MGAYLPELARVGPCLLFVIPSIGLQETASTLAGPGHAAIVTRKLSFQMAFDKDGNLIPEGGEGDQNVDGELQKKLDELSRKNNELASSVSRLTSKNEELIGENRKRARIERILKSLEIDPSAEDAEDLLIKKLSDGIDKNLEAAKGGTGNQSGQGTIPSNESLELKSQLTVLQKQLSKMEEKAKEAERREQEAIEKRRKDYIELKVKEALQKANCIQPSHLFRLKASSFRLSEDGETVIGGSEHDPRSLEDAIEGLKDDPEWGIYFRGSGSTGSGMSKGPGSFGGQSLKNPFRIDQLNVTEASVIFKKDPEKGKRLMIEARNAGKLDPKFAALVS